MLNYRLHVTAMTALANHEQSIATLIHAAYAHASEEEKAEMMPRIARMALAANDFVVWLNSTLPAPAKMVEHTEESIIDQYVTKMGLK